MTGIKGWSHDGEFEHLAELAAESTRPMMEIGTYCGRSAVVLGRVAKQLDTVLFCVDHHRGSPEMNPGQACHDPAMIREWDGRHDSLPDLRRNLADADLESHVIPIVASSQMVAPWWNTDLGLLFIDGGHDEDTVMHDYERFAPHVRSGGVLAMHDSTAGGPRLAADQAEKDGWEPIATVESLRTFRR